MQTIIRKIEKRLPVMENQSIITRGWETKERKVTYWRVCMWAKETWWIDSIV